MSLHAVRNQPGSSKVDSDMKQSF